MAGWWGEKQKARERELRVYHLLWQSAIISRPQDPGEVRQIQSLIVHHSTHPQHPSPVSVITPPVPRLAVTLPSFLCVTACRGSLCSKPRGFLRCLLPHVLPPCTRFTARTRISILFSLLPNQVKRLT